MYLDLLIDFLRAAAQIAAAAFVGWFAAAGAAWIFGGML
jgi:hypothetical protein